MAIFQITSFYEPMHLLSADRYDLDLDLHYLLHEDDDADRVDAIVEFLEENEIRYAFSVDHLCERDCHERFVRLLLHIENDADAVMARLRFDLRLWRPIHEVAEFPRLARRCYDVDGNLATV